MNTKRPLLLSDDDIMQSDSRSPAYEVRDHYEAARAKDAELIQMLVDALEQSHRDGRGAYSITMLDALDAAAAQGFKPSNR